MHQFIIIYFSIVLLNHEVNAEQEFLEQPGDTVLKAEVGQRLLIPCVVNVSFPMVMWSTYNQPSDILTINTTHLKSAYSGHYQLVASGANFSLVIISVNKAEPQVYCQVVGEKEFMSSPSKIQIISIITLSLLVKAIVVFSSFLLAD